MSLRLWVKSVTESFWHANEHCSSSSSFLCAHSLQLHLYLFFLLQPFQHWSLSGRQPNVCHHLFINGPRHGRHHGPPQRPRNGPSEEALESIFLREWEQSEACSWLKPAYSTRYMERNFKNTAEQEGRLRQLPYRCIWWPLLSWVVDSLGHVFWPHQQAEWWGRPTRQPEPRSWS